MTYLDRVGSFEFQLSVWTQRLIGFVLTYLVTTDPRVNLPLTTTEDFFCIFYVLVTSKKSDTFSANWCFFLPWHTCRDQNQVWDGIDAATIFTKNVLSQYGDHKCRDLYYEIRTICKCLNLLFCFKESQLFLKSCSESKQSMWLSL